MGKQETYEYAGFLYRVWRDSSGRVENMVPIEGQHHAAFRDRHRRAAAEQLNQEEGRK